MRVLIRVCRVSCGYEQICGAVRDSNLREIHELPAREGFEQTSSSSLTKLVPLADSDVHHSQREERNR
jgi:hypothetical protein